MASSSSLKKDAPKIVLALVLIWLIFFYHVGFGRRSFADHIYRIVTTPEARELGDEVVSDVRSFAGAVSSRVRGAILGYP